MLNVLHHLQILRFAVPATVVIGVAPQYFFTWLAWRLLSVPFPRRLYERGDEFFYDMYQSLVCFFYETCTGAEVIHLVMITVHHMHLKPYLNSTVAIGVVWTDHFEVKCLIMVQCSLFFLFKVIFYGDPIPWDKQENVIILCNHQSSGSISISQVFVPSSPPPPHFPAPPSRDPAIPPSLRRGILGHKGERSLQCNPPKSHTYDIISVSIIIR